MAGSNQSSVAREARIVYDRIKESLEAAHANDFVAIEPVSSEYFLGETLSDAIGAARTRHPSRLVHAFRVGHKATVHFGLQAQ